MKNVTRRIKATALLLAAALLAGCEMVVLDAPGDVAAQQGDLIIYATVLMLIVILPVMALTVFFAWRYRESNEEASYEPDWDHSISLEIVVWSVPLAIIICLAGLTWVATHRLDPYEPLRRISAEKPIDPSVEPMVVQVVSLDWKWLFIYPEYGIATVNEAATVVDRPIEFRLTSTTVMNAFYVPALSGMIYAMAGMETELNAVMNRPGTYQGLSANYSGVGFSHMHFDFHSFDEAGFEDWVAKVRASDATLDRDTMIALDQQSIHHGIRYYNGVEENLWDRIVNMCIGYDDLCQNDMMMVDALGGGGIAGLYNRELYRGICSADDPKALFAILKPSKLAGRDGEALIAALLPERAAQQSEPATQSYPGSN
ncbi:MAG: ubiquinol oxidase subunit II [Pseudomonadota bacterium]